jgi:hypothetical protein
VLAFLKLTANYGDFGGAGGGFCLADGLIKRSRTPHETPERQTGRELRNAIWSYALRRDDKAVVQMELDEHMIGTSETNLSHPTSRPTERV